MPRMTKEEKRIENEVNAAFRRHSNGNPINIMDIGKVLNAGKEAARTGGEIEAAIVAAFARYRVDC